MSFELPTLPYSQGDLEPHISATTMSFHYGKHHQGYVNKLNDAVDGSSYAGESLEDIITTAYAREGDEGLFNNAAQVWNHTFFWYCMKPGGSEPDGKLLERLNADFGGLEAFKKEFKEAAGSQFGSGWAWLIAEDGRLKITTTPNAVNPLAKGQHALMTVDVWEHAYYLDYQNRRPEFVGAVLDHLLNWEFIGENFSKAS